MRLQQHNPLDGAAGGSQGEPDTDDQHQACGQDGKYGQQPVHLGQPSAGNSVGVATEPDQKQSGGAEGGRHAQSVAQDDDDAEGGPSKSDSGEKDKQRGGAGDQPTGNTEPHQTSAAEAGLVAAVRLPVTRPMLVAVAVAVPGAVPVAVPVAVAVAVAVAGLFP